MDSGAVKGFVKAALKLLVVFVWIHPCFVNTFTKPTLIMTAALEGDVETVLFWLHLRALKRVQFDLNVQQLLTGRTASRVANSEVLADLLLMSQLIHDIACVEDPNECVEMIDEFHESGFSRALIEMVLSKGATSPIVAAVQLRQATRNTVHENLSLSVASAVVLAAFEACADDKDTFKALLRFANDAHGGSFIMALLNADIHEPLALPMMQACVDEAFLTDNKYAGRPLVGKGEDDQIARASGCPCPSVLVS